MSRKRELSGLYVITDDALTPDATIYEQVKLALEGGASIVQLRDKSSEYDAMKQKALKLQELCLKHDALFVLNDRIDLACEIKCDGLHIGKSDHENFESIRRDFDGIIGVSCYGDIELANKFESLGADYVAFGSFFHSPTKPNSNIVPLEIISQAKQELSIPVCAIGGINTQNLSEVMKHSVDMVSIISDIWNSDEVFIRSNFYAEKLKNRR